MDISQIINKIKEKKSLSGIADTVVKKELEEHFRRAKIRKENLSDKDVKIIVHDVRARLRKLSGSFNVESEPEEENILLSHSSTKERADFYDVLREKIYSLKPKSILDLGCGINPIALAKKGIEYYAYDINEENLKLVDSFFKQNKIIGETGVVDLREPAALPDADICIIFKVLDILDEKDHKRSEALLNSIDCKYFLISFSTKTLSGAPMRHPQRGWIELLLTRLGYSFESFSSNNEIFYLATKKAK
ncbi:MAG TPA: hypothetical protein VHA12_02955 [Candidatus Nanoarchaeia archaeon]|nr:hypothetical protein [Candidatus Nanoarchaeia archaeon]